ncbi:hypothetical protein AALP_AA8G189800 [Arabis alpina]|uniref:Aspartic peptidase DDI1-type domain-containing protein n=1 Tax=Arabis alpina TaxID=50452 RepID=A0A087G7Z7_ARAAL|nr:hypothetical protein AALP_AA8G189800 [Arabis alpina]
MIKYQAKGEKDRPKTHMKKLNPGKFSIPCTLGDLEFKDALCDSGSRVKVISYDLVKLLMINELGESPCTLTFGDATSKRPLGVLENYPLKIENCVIPMDFMVMEMDSSKELPLILGTPFLGTTGASLDFLHMKALLIEVDPYTYYPIEPIEASVCGVVSCENGDEEMMSVETNEVVTQDMKENLHVEAYKKSLDMFDSSGIGSMFKLENEIVETLVNEPKGVNGKSSTMSMMTKGKPREKVKNKLTLAPIKKVEGALECKAIWNGGFRRFSKVKINLPTGMNQDEMDKSKMAMKEAFDVDLEDWGPSSIDGSHFVSN